LSARTPLLSVLIVSHDSADVLPRCFDALAAQHSVVMEVIVVDNGSAAPPAAHPRLDRLVRNADNPGFAVACNQAAAQASGEWLLFLNPDCFPGPHDLATLLALAGQAASEGRLGVLGAQLIEADGRAQAASHRRDPTPVRLLESLRRGRASIEPPPPHASALQEVEAISGALMLLSRVSFEAVGGFDEGYRLHFEDLDLCRRLRQKGLRVLFAPSLRILHLKGTSSRRRPLWVAWQKHRGWRRYYERFDAKTLAAPARWAFRLLIWLALPWLLLRALKPSLRSMAQARTPTR
jgi:N-acetylglucosaminyl-diphospho-decaprenol L-rhamnosyltransferase